ADGLDADDGLALVLDLDLPVDALLAAGGYLDLLGGVAEDLEGAALDLQGDGDVLGGLEVVVDVGGEDDLVLLGEEARRLEADEEVLLGEDLDVALADVGAGAHG